MRTADVRGAIEAAEVEALLCDCTISRVITGPDSKPINVGQSRRTFPTSMRRAIVARDQHCRWPGCEKAPGWCEAHHIEHWEHGGDTSVANGVLLYSRHLTDRGHTGSLAAAHVGSDL